jgi:hypothetical protein
LNFYSVCPTLSKARQVDANKGRDDFEQVLNQLTSISYFTEEAAMAKKQEPVKIEANKKTPVKAKAPIKKEVPFKTKSPTKAKETVVKTKFEFSASEAKEVYLVGDFNNWITHATPMKKEKNGLWKTSLPLKPGRYEYRFFVDDNWVSDLSCSGCVPNEFGTMNCVIIVK